MAISTYSDLKSAVAAWAKRSDLTSVIPDFITLTEKRLARTLIPREQETEVELTATPASRYINLPAGFIKPVGLWLKTTLPREKLTQMLPAELPVSNESGEPEYWAVDGARIALDLPAAGAYPFDFRYVASWQLSDANPTNYVLETHPDLYLFGTLTELSKYTLSDEQAAIYEGRFQQALRDAANTENDSRASAVMTTDVGLSLCGGRFNINRGY
jgi:hypothetical protein